MLLFSFLVVCFAGSPCVVLDPVACDALAMQLAEGFDCDTVEQCSSRLLDFLNQTTPIDVLERERNLMQDLVNACPTSANLINCQSPSAIVVFATIARVPFPREVANRSFVLEEAKMKSLDARCGENSLECDIDGCDDRLRNFTCEAELTRSIWQVALLRLRVFYSLLRERALLQNKVFAACQKWGRQLCMDFIGTELVQVDRLVSDLRPRSLPRCRNTGVGETCFLLMRF
jgi:hypothetical protein